MQKRDLYRLLLPHETVYRLTHNRTADIDFEIIQELSKEKSIIQITMDIPCLEATVYRSIARVKQFLEQEHKLCCMAELKNDASKKKS